MASGIRARILMYTMAQDATKAALIFPVKRKDPDGGIPNCRGWSIGMKTFPGRIQCTKYRSFPFPFRRERCAGVTCSAHCFSSRPETGGRRRYFLNLLTVLLGPTYLVRYVLIFWFALPLYLSICVGVCYTSKDNGKSGKSCVKADKQAAGNLTDGSLFGKAFHESKD